MILRTGAWGLLSALLVAGGCKKESTDSAPPTPVIAEAAGEPLLDDGAWQRGFRALATQAGPDAQVLELDLYPDRIVLKARDAEAPDQVLQHVYRGGHVAAPVEVRLLGSGNLEDNLFPMSEVTWDRLPAVAREAVKTVDPAEGRVSHVLVRRNLPHDTAIRIRAYVASPIRDGYVDANARGKILPGG